MTSDDEHPDDEHPDGNVRKEDTSPRFSPDGNTRKEDTALRFSRWLDAWENTIEKYIKKPLQSGLVRIATTSALYPGYTIVIALILSITLVGVGLATNFEIETEGSVLWTPTDSISLDHEHWIENESGFAPEARQLSFILHSQGKNVLTVEATHCLLDVVETVRSTQGYHEMCDGAWGTPECPILTAAKHFNHNRTLFETLAKTDEDVRHIMSALVFPDGQPAVRQETLGLPLPEIPFNTTGLTPEDLLLESAASFLGKVSLVPVQDLDSSYDYEGKVTDNLLSLNNLWAAEGRKCTVQVDTFRAFDDEAIRGITADIPFMAMAFVIMGVFCAFYLSNFKSCTKSQSILGLGAVATIILSILTGYGLLFCIGVPLSSISQIFPYIMVGIGLDDTFIICNAFSRTNSNLDVVKRTEIAMNEVGVSIAVSTLTTVVAFFLGGASSLPGIRWFCWYAAPTVLIDFIHQITFFIAILVYDTRRVNDNRYDCLVCVRAKSVSSDEEAEESRQDLADEISDEAPSSRIETTSFMQKGMYHYGKILLQPLTKAIVLIGFAALLSIGALGASKQSQEFDFRELLPPDSFVLDMHAAVREYSSTTFYLISNIYFRNVDVSSREIRDQMKDYVNDLVDLPYISNPPSLFWVREFDSFLAENSSIADLPFIEQMDFFFDVHGNVYGPDIIRGQAGNVTASRAGPLIFDQTSLTDIKIQIDSLNAQRDVTHQQPINQGKSELSFFTYGLIFRSWELYSVIVKEILLNVSLGLVAVFAISLLFIPHPIGACLLPPVVAAIYVELMGLLYIADISISAVSAIGLVMSIGLVVDYNMHIVMTYYETGKAENRNERVIEVLQTMGSSILIGGFTTLLGVLPLSLSSSEIFRTFFYTFLGISLLSIMHGLIFVPVVLSIVGPHAHLNRRATHKNTSAMPEGANEKAAIADEAAISDENQLENSHVDSTEQSEALGAFVASTG